MSGRELAGALRERVTIVRQAAGTDPLGAADGAWTVLAARWATIRAESGGEAVVGDAASATARFAVTLRAGVEALPGDRIEWAGRMLRVRGVVADPRTPDRIVLKVEELR